MSKDNLNQGESGEQQKLEQGEASAAVATITGEGAGEQPKTYTDDEVNEIISKRLARERQKIEREVREQLEQKAKDNRSEAEKLAAMNATQKAEYEAEKLRARVEELERQQNLAEQTGVARATLAEAGIAVPDEILATIVTTDAEKTQEAVEAFKGAYLKSVNDAVQDALRRKTPPAGGEQGGESYGAKYAKQYSEQRQNGGL